MVKNSSDMSNDNGDYQDRGINVPLPSFDTSSIKLTTVAPALGAYNGNDYYNTNTPDYLDYDTKGRGLVTIMFANTGLSYLLGIGLGGLYGLNEGLKHTPSHRFRIKLNSVLNHCSRHGSRLGNTFGVLSVFYSLYEGAADALHLDSYTEKITYAPPAPLMAGFMTGLTYKAQAGPRVALLAGSIGFMGVGFTYATYSVLNIPYGQKGWLCF